MTDIAAHHQGATEKFCIHVEELNIIRYPCTINGIPNQEFYNKFSFKAWIASICIIEVMNKLNKVFPTICITI